MGHNTTFLQDLIGIFISIVIPLALVMVLVIKNPQTTLSLIKAGFKFLVSAGKFIVPLIVSFIVWVDKTFTNDPDPKPYWPSSSNNGFSSDDVDPVIKYQNGVDGAERY